MTTEQATGGTQDRFNLSWQQTTTPLEAIERALYALADELSGTVTNVDNDWNLAVYPRSSAADATRLAHRLRQEVTDQTLRLRIAERTDPIRNLIFAVAFSHASAKAGEADQSAADHS